MSTAVNTLKFVWTCWKLNLAGAMEFRVSFLLTAGMMFLNDMVWLLFWGLFFQKFNSVGGWGMHEMLMLWATGSAGFGLVASFFGNTMRLANIVSTGTLDVYLAQPKPVLLNVLISRMAVANLGDILFGLAVYAVFGEPTLAGWGKYILSLILIMLLFLTTILIVQSLAFYIGNAEGIGQQFTGSMVTFSLYPTSIFKGWGKLILFTVVPAGIISYVPVGLLGRLDTGFLLHAAATLCCFCVFSVWFFHRGLKRYSSGNTAGIRM